MKPIFPMQQLKETRIGPTSVNKMGLKALILHVHKSRVDTFNAHCINIEMLIVGVKIKITSLFSFETHISFTFFF